MLQYLNISPEWNKTYAVVSIPKVEFLAKARMTGFTLCQQ